VKAFALRLWRAFDAIVLWRLRRARDELVVRGPAVGQRLYRAADAAANLPFKEESLELPEAREVGGVRLDVVDDLAAYTALPSDVVRHELRTRSGVSFRTEWHATPPHLRRDHWFYLSSKAYLFGNAVHFPDASFADDFVLPHLPSTGRVLDFGAGTGNLAMLLAALGLEVWVSEINALQRDFVRFRAARHGLTERLKVIDPWSDVPRAGFGVVVAVDVLEHLPDCRAVLESALLPALVDDGVLVESSPFVVNTSNPMHHEDFGFERFMQQAGFNVVANGAHLTRVWRRRA
jgi:2-polyprenyl-3-methyl-5-hydroxy-6-metoxy-1,4-benzoquinol methylase